jgi:hypothetical protein
MSKLVDEIPCRQCLEPYPASEYENGFRKNGKPQRRTICKKCIAMNQAERRNKKGIMVLWTRQVIPGECVFCHHKMKQRRYGYWVGRICAQKQGTAHCREKPHCDNCAYLTLCQWRVGRYLWAVCEQPDAGDLIRSGLMEYNEVLAKYGGEFAKLSQR